MLMMRISPVFCVGAPHSTDVGRARRVRRERSRVARLRYCDPRMSILTYLRSDIPFMSPLDKPLVWLHGIVTSPPFSAEARREAGFLLRRLQQGELLGLPASRPMPVIGVRCYELRIVDTHHSWRVIYRLDRDAVVIVGVLDKKTQRTPQRVIAVCRARLRAYDLISEGR